MSRGRLSDVRDGDGGVQRSDKGVAQFQERRQVAECRSPGAYVRTTLYLVRLDM